MTRLETLGNFLMLLGVVGYVGIGGMGMQNIQQERALAASGEMQADANMGKGQMKAADFVMTA